MTAAFDGERLAWAAYAAEARSWADALRADVEAGRPPSAAHVRVGGVEDGPRLLEQTEWVAESVERIAQTLGERLAQGDIRAALTVALAPGPGARGFDYRAPGFFHGTPQPGDLRPTWTVPDRGRQDVLREALAPETAPEWFLRRSQAWARPLLRLMWSPTTGLKVLAEGYHAHLREVGNPWGPPR